MTVPESLIFLYLGADSGPCGSFVMGGKMEVLVLYGGRSTEHDISRRSAAFLLRHLDPAKYEVRAIAIDKDGAWLPQPVAALQAAVAAGHAVPILPPTSEPPRLEGPSEPGQHLFALASRGASENGPTKRDVVIFPMIHGTFGEDGTLQGFMEMAEVAFVGPDTLGSAVGMDKVVAKRLVQGAGIRVVPWLDTRRQYWDEHHERLCEEACRTFGFPMFVKPARLGSSVGVSKVKDRDGLRAACEHALAFDDKIMIEKGLDVREIEVAALGDYDPMVSIPGEVMPSSDFYSYEAKYIDADGASIAIPAPLDATQTAAAQAMAKSIFMALDLYGMARIDLFLEKTTGEFYFNEVNTIPGFTEISQYPLLWKASGVPPAELLDRLIDLAIRRRDSKRALKRDR